MRLDDYRWSSLARYHDSALESAVLLLALARTSVHSHFDMHLWEITSLRSDIRMMTELQAFAVNARKALEIANLVVPDIVADAKLRHLHSPGETFRVSLRDPELGLCNWSFWKVISRIIHSVSTIVLREFEELQSTATRIYSQSRNTIFGFASDFDGASAGPGEYVVSTQHTHYIRIERLISVYVGSLANKVDDAIALLRPPLKTNKISI